MQAVDFQNFQNYYRSHITLCGNCSSTFSIKSLFLINAEQSSLFEDVKNKGIQDLHHMNCPKCQWKQSFTPSFFLLYPSQQRSVLVISQQDRYRFLEEKADMLKQLSMLPTQFLPAYCLTPTVTIGQSQLLSLLTEQDDLAPTVNTIPSAQQVQTQVDAFDALLDVALSPKEQALEATQPKFQLNQHQTPTKSQSESTVKVHFNATPQQESPTPKPYQPSLLNTPAPQLNTTPTPSQSIPTSIPLLTTTNQDLNTPAPVQEQSHTVITTPQPANLLLVPTNPITPIKPIHQTISKTGRYHSMDAISSIDMDLEEALLQQQSSTGLRKFDEKAAYGSHAYLKLNAEGELEAAVKLDDRQADGWIVADLDIRIQLHLIDQKAMPCITLFSKQGDQIEDELFWPIPLERVEGVSILEALRKCFRFELATYKKNGAFYGKRQIETPLEENVSYLLSRLKKLNMNSEQMMQAKFLASESSFDRAGKLKHNFNRQSFAEIKNASQAKLAIGIWAYWSSPEQKEYLLLVKSFPLPWLRRIQHRVLKAGIYFGLDMPKPLQKQAIALKLSSNEVDLLQKSIAHFAEVNVKLKPNGLNAMEVWENWSALFERVEELNIHVDEDVELLALRAMKAAGIEDESLSGLDDQAQVMDFDALPQESAQEEQERLSAKTEIIMTEQDASDLIEEESALEHESIVELSLDDLDDSEEIFSAEALIEEEEFLESFDGEDHELNAQSSDAQAEEVKEEFIPSQQTIPEIKTPETPPPFSQPQKTNIPAFSAALKTPPVVPNSLKTPPPMPNSLKTPFPAVISIAARTNASSTLIPPPVAQSTEGEKSKNQGAFEEIRPSSDAPTVSPMKIAPENDIDEIILIEDDLEREAEENLNITPKTKAKPNKKQRK